MRKLLNFRGWGEKQQRFHSEHSKWAGFVLVCGSLSSQPLHLGCCRGNAGGRGGPVWWASQRKRGTMALMVGLQSGWGDVWGRWSSARRAINSVCPPLLCGILTIFSSSLENCRLYIISVNSSSRIWLPGLKKWVLSCVTGTEKKRKDGQNHFQLKYYLLNWGWLCLNVNYFMPGNVIKRMC